MRRLIAAVRALGEPATIVLDAGPDDLLGEAEGVRVVRASRRGRDAADDEIVRLLQDDADPATVTVVTSDSTLAARARALGAQVEGAGAFRARLGG